MSAHMSDRVDALMLALEEDYGRALVTPGGVSWLHTHHVPIRRLVTRVVKRLETMSDSQPGPGLCSGKLVVAHHAASLGYVTYGVSEAGISYLLGRSTDDEPEEVDEHRQGVPVADGLPNSIVPTPVCAVTWSSRHAETLWPLLTELARRGIASAVVDLATETGQRFPDDPHVAITVLRVPEPLFLADGSPPAHVLRAVNSSRTTWVGRHEISVRRMAELVSQTLARSGGCTHPSWAASVEVESWLDQVLVRLRPGVLLCSNDTSPSGILAVRAAERVGADTVYVQHGAWVAGQAVWRAQHCRHIAVMGARDVVTAHDWKRRADARTYVVGQPRFDVLAMADRAQQRAYLERTLSSQAGSATPRVLVWACQPSSEQRLLGQFDVLVEGLRHTGHRWGLVIAPHPAQSPAAFLPFMDATDDVAMAVAAPDVGARGCLAGADALVTASSTCGIEALLLDVPVLELALPASRTLGLAEHQAAQRCTSSEEIAIALARTDRTPEAVRVPAAAKQAICHWDGNSAASIADIVAKSLSARSGSQPPTGFCSLSGDPHDDALASHHWLPGQGVTER